MDPFTPLDDPRCPQCNVPLVRVGAICVGCDEGRHYSSPDRTSPLMRFEQVADTFQELSVRSDIEFNEEPAARRVV